jgi:hypothetical protein
VSYVIRVVALTGYHLGPGMADPSGLYFADADVEAHSGRGEATFTSDPRQAKRFANAARAMAWWRQVPEAMPVRPDGEPNRPLTAYTVEILPDPVA